MPVTLRNYDRVAYSEFSRLFIPGWEQTQHVVLNGPTGVGKTTLLRHILPRRNGFVIFLGTKSHDESYQKILRDGFTRVYDHNIPRYVDRAFIWPTPGRSPRETKQKQRDVFLRVLDRVWQLGHTTLVIDEAHWLCHDLGLGDEIATFHHQGRSNGITLIDGMQRPAFVPVVVHSSADHGIIWKLTEPTDIKRLAGIGGLETKELVENMRRLSKHEFIYVPTRGANIDPVPKPIQKGGK